MSIQRLPGAVAAHIKSSSTVSSLNEAVLGLLRNSLDSGAARVTITVDYGRGSFAVDDDGSGIPSDEFLEDGGLGKLYYTSKYPPSKGLHGRYGVFLASVADLSLLTIVSRGKSHGSESTLTIHNGKVLRRHASTSKEDTTSTDSGTRVTVRDLFGCMPVRARLRPLPDSATWSRVWDSLICSVTALLLAWPSDVSVAVHDEVNGTKKALKAAGDSGSARTASLLSQAGLCENVDPSSWASIGASAPGVNISGSICLQPSASRKAQFIHIGVIPVYGFHQAYELYSEIQKLFAESGFGVPEGTPKGNRPSHKPMGLFARGQRLRKSVDRWPMFSIGIDLDGTASVDDVLDDRRQHLTIVRNLIRTVITEFLKKHGFYEDSATLYGQDEGAVTPETDEAPPSPTKKQKTRELDTSLSFAHANPASKALPRRSKDAKSLFSTWPQTKSAKSKTKPAQTVTDSNPESKTHKEGAVEEQSRFFARTGSPEDVDGPQTDQCCTTKSGMEDWDSNTLANGDLKISRASLEAAQVIGQVDNKFILIRAPSISDPSTSPEGGREDGPLLILVDQHAADERCRVEKLLRNYFAATEDGTTIQRFGDASTTVLSQPLQFELSANERPLLERSRSLFRHWGISYDVLSDKDNDGPETHLRVTALPTSIADRCKQEPRLVVDIIRKEIWEPKDEGVAVKSPNRNTPWPARFQGCPKGILDLINSRACKSAIKFNDPLTHDECANLLHSLFRCSFPFQCAHGRPSMVPLLNIGPSESSDLY